MLEAVHKVKTSFIAAIFLLAAERNESSTMFYFRIVGTLKTGTGNEERIVVTVSFTPCIKGKLNFRNMYKYYVMSKQNNHALGVIEETETTMTVQKLKVDKVFDKFTNDYKEEIVADFSMEQVNNATIPKDDLSFRIEEVEITKDYWVVFEYLTGRKRKAVANSSEA